MPSKSKEPPLQNMGQGSRKSTPNGAISLMQRRGLLEYIFTPSAAEARDRARARNKAKIRSQMAAGAVKAQLQAEMENRKAVTRPVETAESTEIPKSPNTTEIVLRMIEPKPQETTEGRSAVFKPRETTKSTKIAGIPKTTEMVSQTIEAQPQKKRKKRTAVSKPFDTTTITDSTSIAESTKPSQRPGPSRQRRYPSQCADYPPETASRAIEPQRIPAVNTRQQVTELVEPIRNTKIAEFTRIFVYDDNAKVTTVFNIHELRETPTPSERSRTSTPRHHSSPCSENHLKKAPKSKRAPTEATACETMPAPDFAAMIAVIVFLYMVKQAQDRSRNPPSRTRGLNNPPADVLDANGLVVKTKTDPIDPSTAR